MDGNISSTLTRESVRTAVLHLIELAAAYEGRGTDLEPVPGKDDDVFRHFGREPSPQPAAHDDDTACLEVVVRELLRHRQHQRLLQRNAIVDRLVVELASMFRAFKNDELTHAQIDERMQLISAGLCLEVGAHFDYLTPEKSEITEVGGPVEAAKEAIRGMVNLGKTRISEIRKDPPLLDDACRPFGRWVTRRQRLAYVQDVHADVLRQTENVLLSFPQLGALDEDEVAGLVQDRRVEGRFRDAFEQPQLLSALLGNERWQRLLDAIETRVRTNITEVLEGGAPAMAIIDLPESIQERLGTYIAAREAHGEESIAAEIADRALEEAIPGAVGGSVLDALRRLLPEECGELDTPPVPSPLR